MGRNKTKLIAGICFLVGSGICIFSIIENGVRSYYVTGLIVFAIVGIGMLRASKQ